MSVSILFTSFLIDNVLGDLTLCYCCFKVDARTINNHHWRYSKLIAAYYKWKLFVKLHFFVCSFLCALAKVIMMLIWILPVNSQNT